MFNFSKSNLSYYFTALLIIVSVGGWLLLNLDWMPLRPVGDAVFVLGMIVFPILGFIFAFFIENNWLRFTMIILNVLIGAFTVTLGILAITFSFFVSFA